MSIETSFAQNTQTQIAVKKRFRFIQFEQDSLVLASLQCRAFDPGDGTPCKMIWKEHLIQGGRRLYDLMIDPKFKNKEGVVIDFGVRMVSLPSKQNELWLSTFDYVYDDNWPWVVTLSLSGNHDNQFLNVKDYARL